ncbi:MAG: SPASM domain-containing protein, partial [Proteobacteria bacterium]|nr:SPASM domain-containing protein [Pseudomonadota bacterium]
NHLKKPVLNTLRKMNVDTIEECSECPIRLICAGRCRARYYYESGSIETVVEFFEYEKGHSLAGQR